MRIRIARKSDAMTIARLHVEAFRRMGATFLSRLGVKALSDLYSLMMATGGTIVLVAEEQEGVVGFIAGAANTRRVALLSFRVVVKALLGCYHMEMSIGELMVQGLRHGLYLFNRRLGEDQSELLIIVIHPRHQGRGIGHELVRTLVECLRRIRSESVRVLVDTRWTRALSFYRNVNFVQVGTVKTPSGLMQLLEKRLA